MVRLVLVLLLIGRKTGASLFGQSLKVTIAIAYFRQSFENCSKVQRLWSAVNCFNVITVSREVAGTNHKTPASILISWRNGKISKSGRNELYCLHDAESARCSKGVENLKFQLDIFALKSNKRTPKQTNKQAKHKQNKKKGKKTLIGQYEIIHFFIC